MIIDEIQSSTLKEFLCASLESICDAEPSVLSDYIIALLKHDKSAVELKISCRDQLSDFLREETDNFVDKLFEYLQSHFYSFETKASNSTSADTKAIESDDDEERFRKHRRIESERKPPTKDVFEDESHRKGKRGICRDFDQNGFCLRGDMCPYDHGEDRINISSSVQVRNSDRKFQSEERPRFRKRENLNTKLIVEKIPFEHCTIAKVHDFFSKFGTLVNITVNGPMQRATLQFSSPSEASMAHQSPEPVFNNRFVKIYWDKSSGNVNPTREDIVEKKVASPSPHSVQKIPPKIAAQKKKQENLKVLLELQKKKYTLLESSITQQKTLLAKLSSSSTSEKDRAEILDALKPIEESIKAIRASIAEDKDQETPSEEELLKAKLDALKAEANALGLVDEKGDIRKPILRGGKRAAIGRSLKLDNRTATLVLSHLPDSLKGSNEELEKMCQPFKEISKYKFGLNNESIILEFSNRTLAEKALQAISKTAIGKSLKILWKPKEEEEILEGST